jgi:membrane protein YdbS with pleckstrin-like domain
MTTNETVRSRGMFVGWSAVFRAVRLLIFGLIGWLWFVLATDSAWKAISLAAVLALAALVGITWYLSRVRAERRWRAALDAYAKHELDAYAKQEQANGTNSRRNFDARPQSQDR